MLQNEYQNVAFCCTFDKNKFKFKNSVNFTDGRYFADLPFKEDLLPKLPSNRTLAFKRMQRNLRNDQVKLGYYHKIIMEQLS